MRKVFKEVEKALPEPEDYVAKKDFEINHNDFHLVIKEGDSLADIPEIYLENLKTEGVL